MRAAVRTVIFGTMPFSITDLFVGGVAGFYYDFSRPDKLFQTTDTSTPITTAGQTIGRVDDLSPNASPATQSSSGFRPAWQATYANFDGTDDHVLSSLTPSATAMTVGACFRGATATRYAMASFAGSTDRSLGLGLNSSGYAAASCGDQSLDGSISGSIDFRNADLVALARMTGTFVELFVNGVLSDSATVGGSPNTTLPYAVGARWNGSAIANPWSGRIYRAFAVKAAIPAKYIVPASRALGLGVVSI